MVGQRDTVRGTEQLTPTKGTLTALKSDVDFPSAIEELIDNALDAWERESDREAAARIQIYAEEHGDRTELIITDNTGGIPRDEAAMVFGLGRTAKGEEGGLIGTYGIGAKKSLVNLGVPFRIISRAEDADVGWEYRITEDWFEDETDWTVDVYPNEEIDPGHTEIHIEDLEYEWNEANITELREDFARTYNLFLDDSLLRESYDLTIEVDGEPVRPVGLPDWSYSPFDGFAPRRFENITLDLPEFDEPVTANITVGLLRKKDSQNAGVDIYIQKRQVMSAVRDEDGGFGHGNNRLGPFTVHKERLKVLIEIEARDHGNLLPWDTQKSSINRNNVVMRGTDDVKGVYNWLRRVAQPYYNLDANKVPRAFVEFYPRDSEHADRGTTPEGDPIPYRHDYRERKQVSHKHKPDEDLSDVRETELTAEAHAKLGIRCDRAVEDWRLPAYRAQLEQECSKRGRPVDYADLERLTVEPVGLDVEHVDETLDQIQALAKRHAQDGIRFPNHLEPWMQPAYDRALDEHADVPLDTVAEPPADLPTTPDEVEAATATEGDTEPEPTGGETGIGVDVPGSDVEVEEETEADSIELLLGVREDGEEQVAPLISMPPEQFAERFGIPEDADRDTLYREVKLRLLESVFEDQMTL